MSHLPRPPVRMFCVFALAAGACVAGVKPTAPDGGGGGSGSGGMDAAAPTGTDAPVVMDMRPNVPEVSIVDGGTCTPSVTCTPANGRYCGVIGNGCFGTIDCGGCPTDQVCDNGVCVGGASCMPLA